ncbi:MAG: tRNA (adenosine(37)-N6)-threonylcarbamoyltransferase complex transferase subunit TsaD [Bacteroidota bacterium]
MSITILAIESSCDETSAAIIKNGLVLSNIVAAQDVHKEYGGVVPELASRAHQQNIIPVVDKAIKEAGIDKTELSAIAFTRGPGLLGALIVGTSFAKAMALGLDIPLIEVNHMQAHILAHFIDDPKPSFPFLCLTVSGGHTQLVVINDYLDMTVIGETRDDAAGEAFDKSAKLLGLEYPGGPLIDSYARKGDANRFKFSKSSMPAYDFSFSGLKTSVLYFLRKQIETDENFIKDNLYDLSAGVQKAIIEMLTEKLTRAADDHNIMDIAIAGGVSANSGLRDAITLIAKDKGWKTYFPEMEYCTDNAAMIGIAGYHKYLKNDFVGLDIAPLARMPLI